MRDKTAITTKTTTTTKTAAKHTENKNIKYAKTARNKREFLCFHSRLRRRRCYDDNFFLVQTRQGLAACTLVGVCAMKVTWRKQGLATAVACQLSDADAASAAVAVAVDKPNKICTAYVCVCVCV